MIGLLPMRKLIAWLAVTYGLIIIGLLYAHEALLGPLGLVPALKVALAGAAPIQVVLLVLLSRGWRTVWQWIPQLNVWLFPDLNGTWIMSIDWVRNDCSGKVEAIAVIRQDFFRMSMEVNSPGSDSQTLSVQPKRDGEFGAPILHYLFRVTPRAIGCAPNPYEGAAILRYYRGTEAEELRGNYWTASPSVGHYHLTRQA